MYILGIDFGTKKLGLAIMESYTKITSPLPLMKNDDFLWRNLGEVLDDYRIKLVVVGLPSYENTAKKVHSFAKILTEKFGIETVYSPEDNTSIVVKKELTTRKQKANLDSMSAIAILQQWASSNFV